jgi:hypothetical protein
LASIAHDSSSGPADKPEIICKVAVKGITIEAVVWQRRPTSPVVPGRTPVYSLQTLLVGSASQLQIPPSHRLSARVRRNARNELSVLVVTITESTLVADSHVPTAKKRNVTLMHSGASEHELAKSNERLLPEGKLPKNSS